MRCISAGILFADVACWPIDHLPNEGEVATAERIVLNLGGCAANIALDLARLGVPVALSGSVGDDGLSDFVAKSVAVPGVETTGLQRVRNNGPGTAMHINVKGQDRRFICATGANDAYVFDDYLESLILAPNPGGAPRVFSLSGLLMLAALENERTPAFLDLARRNGWTTILDVVLFGSRPYWGAIRPMLPFADYFVPNEQEAEQLCGKGNAEEQARFFLDHGAGAAVITQGEKGTHFASSATRFHAPAFPTTFVSGAGSGDAFSAGLIAALLDGHDPATCVRWGSALGASCVRGLGTTETVFNRAELLAFLDANGEKG